MRMRLCTETLRVADNPTGAPTSGRRRAAGAGKDVRRKSFFAVAFARWLRADGCSFGQNDGRRTPFERPLVPREPRCRLCGALQEEVKGSPSFAARQMAEDLSLARQTGWRSRRRARSLPSWCRSAQSLLGSQCCEGRNRSTKREAGQDTEAENRPGREWQLWLLLPAGLAQRAQRRERVWGSTRPADRPPLIGAWRVSTEERAVLTGRRSWRLSGLAPWTGVRLCGLRGLRWAAAGSDGRVAQRESRRPCLVRLAAPHPAAAIPVWPRYFHFAVTSTSGEVLRV
jgi:hypothetical protein